jgi:hypothetical protein
MYHRTFGVANEHHSTFLPCKQPSVGAEMKPENNDRIFSGITAQEAVINGY